MSELEKLCKLLRYIIIFVICVRVFVFVFSLTAIIAYGTESGIFTEIIRLLGGQ